AMATGPAQLPALGRRLLGELLQQVEDTDLLWLREICEEAAQMFGSSFSAEPQLMPKTPSQKSRQRRKRPSAPRDGEQQPRRKRLSRRRISSLPRRSQRLQNKENQEPSKAETKPDCPTRRVTRSQVVRRFASSSEILPQALPARPVEVSVSDTVGAEPQLQMTSPKAAELFSETIILSRGSHGSPRTPAAASEAAVPCAAGADGAGGSAAAPLQKVADAAVVVSEEPGLEQANKACVAQEVPGKEPSQHPKENPGTPTGSRLSCHSLRRSLMGKTSLTRRTSLAEKYSLANKRASATRRSHAATAKKSKAAWKTSLSSSCADASSSAEVSEDEETVVRTRPPAEPGTPAKLNPQSPRMSLRSRNIYRNQETQEPPNSESSPNKNGETQEPPQSARRKPSYKRAVDDCYDHQQAEEGGLSPPRKKTLSPAFPASRVVRPFKTFLHTVQKNQLLMTPSSAGRSGVIRSFIRHNTPLQPDPREKERQKLETLRKKQEAEKLRRQKLEEDKKRRLEEARLKREERLRRVLQARERAEQMEEERKRRIEHKIALFDGKSEKVREERLAEEKIKKKAAAKKMEEAEARRRQEEEARRQRVLQQEEEERRQKELMQKRKEEEQERARRLAEQRQAEQERKKEQERLQAEKLREEQEKAARLQKEALAAKEQLHQDTEEVKEVSLAVRVRQQQLQLPCLLLTLNPAAACADLMTGKNLPATTSYQMTPQAPKNPKPPVIDPNNYGLDLNSDDSTDDESQPRKPIPAWATGSLLNQAILRQYYNPPDVDSLFGVIASPKLEDIFYKSKPRYFKRTSSAVWNSPPFPGA
ncbi:INCE protein, partial [Rhinopomastus cyanomelas]|nr:INCE protein [Rhinopomastus cyanomelas]